MKVIIIGGGKVGAYIAKLLLNSNCSVKLIENREIVLNKLRRDLPEDILVYGSGSEPNILEACGISETDVVAAVTGADETNLVASTIAKFEFDVPRVIARVNNPQNAWLFNSGMGVDVALNQADLMAHLVVEEMDLKNILTLMELNRGDYSIVQVKIDNKSLSVNKTLRDLVIPANAVLIAINRGKEVIIPRGDTIINSGDSILVFADKDSQVTLNELFGVKR
jgi:trk system potassium uptake protein TrkA